MRDQPTDHDIDIVVHALLAVAIVAADAAVLLFLVPDLFDRHRTELDVAALAAAVGALAFTYLAGRHLWRSIQAILAGED